MNHRKWWVALACLLCTFSAYQSLKIGFIYDLEQFFPSDDEDVSFLKTFQNELERDDLFVLIALENKPSIYERNFLSRVHKYTLALRQHPQVAKAEGLTTFRRIIKTPFGWILSPLIRPNQPDNFQSDSLAIAANSDVYKQFVSAQHDAVAISVKTTHQLSQTETDAFQHHLDSLTAAFGFDQVVHYGGVITTQSVFVKKIQSELVLFISLSILLVTATLWGLYRKFWGIVIPLITVVSALVVFMGYLGITDQDFNIMSTMFPTLMLIFGMSDIIHLQSKYIDGLNQGMDQREAMRLSLQEIGQALWLTSLTTAIGFGSLLTSSTPAIRQFGVNAAIGVMIAFVVVIVFGSALLSFFNLAQLQKSSLGSKRWEKFSLWLFTINYRHPKRIAMGIALTIAVCLLSLPYVTTNSYLLGDIPERSKLRQDFHFFENSFAGVRPFELAIQPQGNRKIFDKEVLAETIKLSHYLEEQHGIKSLYSPAKLMQRLHAAEMTVEMNQWLNDSTQLASMTAQLVSTQGRMFFKLWNENLDFGRISGRIHDTGSDSLLLQIAEIKSWIYKNIPSDVVRFKPTGSVLLVDKNHEYLRKNLFFSLGFAFVLVACIFAWLFRDWRMVLVSIIPNVIPMLVAGAALALTGIELKAVTSVIFTVSFGIAVDDTIHFLTRYKLQRKRGDSVHEAMRATFVVSVKAITITTILLVIGFVSLIFSAFTGTYYVGILICVTLVSAWLADIFVIPQLLYLINPGSREAHMPGDSQKQYPIK